MDYVDKAKKINLEEFRKAINLIFDHIRDNLELEEIDLDHDYYANIGLEDKFDAITQTNDAGFLDKIELDLGQLYDDWEFLEKMMNNDSAILLMFEHVAPLLRYICYKELSKAT